MDSAWSRLADRWSRAMWGEDSRKATVGVLERMLRECLDEGESEAMIAIPLSPVPLEVVPFEDIAAASTLQPDHLRQVLGRVASRGLLVAGTASDGRIGYGLLSQNYGFSQIFYWGGPSELGRRMSELERDPAFAAAKRNRIQSAATKVFRYIPISAAVDPCWQNVYPTESIEQVLDRATRFAVAHCPCRVRRELETGEACGHPTEVCLKLDDLADFAISAGVAREIDRLEAGGVIRTAARAGLVHFADNAGQGIKHICNCCGCACWSLVPLRRREIPRDALMATYFIRATDVEACVGCGRCVDRCPVDAVLEEGGKARVDTDWCVGCGVCVPLCPVGAISLRPREPGPPGARDFRELHQRVKQELEEVTERDEGDG